MNRFAGTSDIDSVRNATDLVRLIGEHVSLRPKGREHVGLCPFHDDRNPSFAVVTHKGNAFYKCHSCGAGGDAFDFVKNYHRMEFSEALRFLADRAGIPLTPHSRQNTTESAGEHSPRSELRKANAFAATFFQRVLSDPVVGTSAKVILRDRGISDEMVEAFAIGAAPDQWDGLCNRIRKQRLNESLFLTVGLLKKRSQGEGSYDAFRNRLIFPICDDLGNPIAFGGRKINPEDEPKYLNSAESALFSKSKTLYGLHHAKRAIIESKTAIVTEGYTDVIACHQSGVGNTVGTLGTALTRDHARLLSRLCDTVVLVFDGDEAGQKAADRGLEVFFAESVDVKICVLPDELDPDELLKQNSGRARFDAAISRSVNALDFKADRYLDKIRTNSSISARAKLLEQFVEDMLRVGFPVANPERGSLIANRIDQLFSVPLGTSFGLLASKQRQKQFRSVSRENAAGSDSNSNVRHNAFDDILHARRRAEQEVLAILIYQPDLYNQRIDLVEDCANRLTDVLSLSDFTDPLTGIIAESAFSHFERGETFTVQQLLGQVTQPQAHTLASSLYFHGQTLCETPPTDSASRLRDAIQSLRSHIRFEEYNQTVNSYRVATATRNAPQEALLAAQSVIEQRRQQKKIAGAIAHGVRS